MTTKTKTRKQVKGNRSGYVFPIRLRDAERALCVKGMALELKQVKYLPGGKFGLGTFIKRAAIERAAMLVKHARKA